MKSTTRIILGLLGPSLFAVNSYGQQALTDSCTAYCAPTSGEYFSQNNLFTDPTMYYQLVPGANVYIVRGNSYDQMQSLCNGTLLESYQKKVYVTNGPMTDIDPGYYLKAVKNYNPDNCMTVVGPSQDAYIHAKKKSVQKASGTI